MLPKCCQKNVCCKHPACQVNPVFLDLPHLMIHVNREATKTALEYLKSHTPEGLAFGITMENIRDYHFLGFVRKADLLGKSDPRSQKEKTRYTQKISAALAVLGIEAFYECSSKRTTHEIDTTMETETRALTADIQGSSDASGVRHSVKIGLGGVLRRGQVIIASFSRTVYCSDLDTEGMEFLGSILLAMYAAHHKRSGETSLLRSDNAATVNKTYGKWTSKVWTSICLADVLRRLQARQGDTSWVPREQNTEADAMAFDAYKTHTIQPRCPVFEEFIKLIAENGFDISATPPPPPPTKKKHRGFEQIQDSPKVVGQHNLPADAFWDNATPQPPLESPVPKPPEQTEIIETPPPTRYEVAVTLRNRIEVLQREQETVSGTLSANLKNKEKKKKKKKASSERGGEKKNNV